MQSFSPGHCFLDMQRKPVSHGKLYFYDKEINALKPVFKDYERSVPHLNPVELGLGGEAPEIFLLDGDNYRVELRDSRDQIIWIHEIMENITDAEIEHIKKIRESGCYNCLAYPLARFQCWRGYKFCSIKCIDEWDESGEWKGFMSDKEFNVTN